MEEGLLSLQCHVACLLLPVESSSQPGVSLEYAIFFLQCDIKVAKGFLPFCMATENQNGRIYGEVSFHLQVFSTDVRIQQWIKAAS